jgi:hypothetical protein
MNKELPFGSPGEEILLIGVEIAMKQRRFGAALPASMPIDVLREWRVGGCCERIQVMIFGLVYT